MRQTTTPLPKFQLAILTAVIFSEPVSLLILFPFIYFMVRDFNLTNDPKEIGFYVGFIASSFSLAGMISGLFWGWLSDRIGRRPVLLFGLFGNTVFSTMFGLSKSFTWAIITRLCCGLVDANVGVAKSMLSELTDVTNEGQGFSVFGMAFGMGSILGPMLGGLLSDPATKYPEIFGGIPFLEEYPYFLPCFISSWVSTVGFVVGYFYLEETLVRAPSHRHESDNETTSLLAGVYTPSVPSEVVGSTWKNMMNLSVVSAILPYTVICLLQVIHDEVFALWAVTQPNDGGLAFQSKEIGYALSYNGIMGLLIQLVFFPSLQQRYGNLVCYRWGVVGFVLVYFMLPNLSFFAREHQKGELSLVWLWGSLFAVLTVRSFSGVFAFTSAMLFVSTAGRQMQALGLLNGIGQFGAGLARAIGPAMAGTMWSWSLLNDLGFPFDYHFVFYLLVVLGILAISQTYIFSRYMTRFQHSEIPVPILE